MTRLSDLSAANWIERAKKPFQGEGEPARVENFMPSGFERYAKLFHPIYADPSVTDHAISWHESRESDSVGVSLGGTLVRESANGRELGERIRWSELAHRYGLDFHPELNAESFTRVFRGRSWPRYLLGPDEGTLDEQTCEALESVMSRDGTAECYFFYSGISVYFTPEEGYTPQLYRGCLADIHHFFRMDEVNASPEYWWPQGRAWCVHTNYDLPFTLIGGAGTLIDALAEHPHLEALPVSERTRLDHHSDTSNVGR